MKTHVLISCVSKKLDRPASAKDIYVSPLFKSAYQYATSLKPDTIFILSAKYGLLSCDEVIAPYDETLNYMKATEVEAWAKKVLSELSQKTDLKEDHFVFLAGDRYRKYLVPHLRHYRVPLEGLGIGRQLSWLKSKTSNGGFCAELHALLQNAERHSFPFDAKAIPKNGIYVLFEKEEKGHGADRIVRIGTHTGNNQLRSRLHQHFLKENKDRSIFRKNIGRAILNKANDPFLEPWEWDVTPTANKKKYSSRLNFARQAEVEALVSDHIRKHFSFVVCEVQDKEQRLELESRLISTVSRCTCCGPSDSWLGLHSPKKRIRESGLWLVNELYKDPLRATDWEFLCKQLGGKLL